MILSSQACLVYISQQTPTNGTGAVGALESTHWPRIRSDIVIVLGENVAPFPSSFTHFIDTGVHFYFIIFVEKNILCMFDPDLTRLKNFEKNVMIYLILIVPNSV